MKDKTLKICKICGKSINCLQIHLIRHHNFTKIENKNYFDLYIEPYNHLCPNCGSKLEFKSFTRGYKKFCSQSCQIKYLIKIKNPNIHIFNSDFLKNEKNIKKLKDGLKKFYLSDKGHELSKQRSVRQIGENNTCHKMSIESKKEAAIKLSKKMKELIASGKFTPCITNSWANSKCKLLHIDNYEKFYRSSWDAAFQILNPDFKYEKLRIKYIGEDNKEHNYIVDFINDDKKILVEIKPNRINKFKKKHFKRKCCKRMV